MKQVMKSIAGKFSNGFLHHKHQNLTTSHLQINKWKGHQNLSQQSSIADEPKFVHNYEQMETSV